MKHFDIRKHLRKKFPLYLVGVVAVPFMMTYIIQWRTQPSDVEKYTFIYGTTLTKRDDLKTYLKNAIGDGIKEFTIVGEPYSDNFYQTYQFNFIFADLVLLPKEAVKYANVSSYTQITSESEYYANDNFIMYNVHYGLRIDNKTNDFASCFSYEEEKEYYLFVPKDSIHNGDKSDKTKELITKIFG